MKPLLTTLLILTVSLAGCTAEDFEEVVEDITREIDRDFTLPEDLITKNKYTKWTIEIDYETGYEPDTQALRILEQRLNEVVKKDNLDIRVDEEISESYGTYTKDKAAELRDKYKSYQNNDNTITTYVLFLGGSDAENSDTLGYASNHNFIVIYKKQLQDSCTLDNFCLSADTTIETAILVHEFGHLIGLVNNGIEMVENHEDPEHPKHSDNPDSVMYWALDSSAQISGLREDIPTEFDRQDKQDICNAGGKCP